MIRYQIYTDTFEFRFGTAKDSIPELSSDDIWDMYTERNFISPVGERCFATKVEAVNYFGENYSDYGTTWAEKGFSFWVLRGRLAFLSEEEYDDDGEFDQDLGTLCISVEPYEKEEEMKICKELIEKKHDEIIETMKKADAMAYRNTGCEYRVYIDTDGNVDREEWPANDNGYYSFRDSDYSREYIHTFCHQFYSILWDGWFTSQAEFAEQFKGRFGVELEFTDRYSFEADGEDTILKNGLSVTNWYEWLDEQTEEAINWFVGETDYEMILDDTWEDNE